MKTVMIDGEEHKQCTHKDSKCGNEWLPLSTDFFRWIKGKYPVWDSACTPCRNAINREKYNAKNRRCDVVNLPLNEQMAHYVLPEPPWKPNVRGSRVLTGIFGTP